MTILCYHSVDPSWVSPLSLAPAEFEAHCVWLASNRTVVGLEEGVRRLDARGRLPRGTTALTFDDGFADIYEHARPILMRHRIPATVFLVARTLTDEGAGIDWVDEADALPSHVRTLSADEILELSGARVGFGSHTFSHPDLTRLSEEQCIRELRLSREVLEDLLHCPVGLLAYPRGKHNERVRRAAARAGFTHAFALPDGPEPTGPLAVPRVGIYRGNDVARLRVKTSPWYLPVRTSRWYSLLRRLRASPEVPRGYAPS